MSEPQQHTPKLLAGKIRQFIRRELKWYEKYPDREDSQPAAVLAYLRDSVDKGLYDWKPRHTVHGMPERLDRAAFRRYLTKGIQWCNNRPDIVSTPQQLALILDKIEEGYFTPMKRADVEQRRTAVSGPRTISPTSVPQIDLNTSQNGAQGQSEAYADYRATLIDTEAVEKW